MKQTDAVVQKVVDITYGIERPSGRNMEKSFIITLDCPEVAGSAIPGQFVMIQCGQSNHVLPRPVSINRVQGSTISLYVAVLENGRGTQWLSERNPGDVAQVIGPVGNGFSLANKKKIVLVAGGMGIAPLVFLAEEAEKQNIECVFLYGTPGKDRYPVEKYLSRTECVIVTEDGSEGRKGFVTGFIPEYTAAVDHVFICGPSAMYETIYRNRRNLLNSIPASVSLESRMACGRGICYGCTITTVNGSRRVCEDGPVFNLEELVF